MTTDIQLQVRTVVERIRYKSLCNAATRSQVTPIIVVLLIVAYRQYPKQLIVPY